MPEFWVASGHHLTRRRADGRLAVTPEWLSALLARPELLPPPEACAAERALHARLRADPLAAVPEPALAALADPDAAENWRLFLALRDLLTAAGSIEAATARLLAESRLGGAPVPALFRDWLVQLSLRNALDGCADPFTLRAAEAFFRPQHGFVRDGAVMLADAEIAAAIEAQRHSDPLGLMLSGGLSGLDVLKPDTAWSYWSRSDAHTTVLPLGAEAAARDGLAAAAAAFLRHVAGVPARVQAVTGTGPVAMRWYAGLNAEGSAIGDALWHGHPLPADLVAILAATPESPDDLDPAVAARLDGGPVWLLLGLPADGAVRLKPQNLLAAFPRAPVPATVGVA